MKNLFPRLLIIILIFASAYLIFYPLCWASSLNSSLFLLLNFIVILAATYWGASGVLVFGFSSLLLSLLYSQRISKFAFSPIILLTVTACICYGHFLKLNHLKRKINTEIDNLEEEKNVLSFELEHLRLENDALGQKFKRYTALKNLMENLSFTLSLDKTFSSILDEVFRIIGKFCVGLLYLVDKERQELNLVSTKLCEPQIEVKLKKGDIFDQWVFKQRLPLLVEDTKKDFRFNLQDIDVGGLRGVRSLISAPLIRENKLLGILRLENVSSNIYDTDDLRLLDIISDLACVSIENTLFYQETERLAITDGLTGLFVHRYFQERFDQELKRALWAKSHFAFLMFDIDDFKNYNDKFGHIAGDIVLKRIAKLILSSVDPGDIVARYGGEEFAVLLVDTTREEALKITEQIREKVEKEEFILRRQMTEVSISGGIAFFPEDGMIKESLIKKADQALYKAKAQGKNRICTF